MYVKKLYEGIIPFIGSEISAVSFDIAYTNIKS